LGARRWAADQGQILNLPGTSPCHTKGETGNRGQGAFETRPYATMTLFVRTALRGRPIIFAQAKIRVDKIYSVWAKWILRLRFAARRMTGRGGRTVTSSTQQAWKVKYRVGRCKGASNMIRDILKMGDERLLGIAQPVAHFDTPALHALIADLFDTMHAAHGAGLAAPQIGVDLQVVVFGIEPAQEEDDVPQTVLINPVIHPLSQDMEAGWEGCLSVPGLRGRVDRFSMIRYRGFDQYGKLIDRTAEGFHARVVQHECDHLIGKLYPMRITDFTTFGFTDVLFPPESQEGDSQDD
jgi:peptide deformylase